MAYLRRKAQARAPVHNLSAGRHGVVRVEGRVADLHQHTVHHYACMALRSLAMMSIPAPFAGCCSCTSSCQHVWHDARVLSRYRKVHCMTAVLHAASVPNASPHPWSHAHRQAETRQAAVTFLQKRGAGWGRRARHHLVHDGAHAPPVALHAVPRLQQHLGRDVVRRAHRREGQLPAVGLPVRQLLPARPLAARRQAARLAAQRAGITVGRVLLTIC